MKKSIRKRMGKPGYDYRAMERFFARVLSRDEKMIMKKSFPFRKERDALLRDLKCRGARVRLLSIFSGISESHLWRIVKGLNNEK